MILEFSILISRRIFFRHTYCLSFALTTRITFRTNFDLAFAPRKFYTRRPSNKSYTEYHSLSRSSAVLSILEIIALSITA